MINLPTISIITPSLNQGQFIEKAITSVIEQNYPNLEYLVIDGGSEDSTLSILKKYKNKIKYLSEKDKGQSDALNKGLSHTSGEIIGYLNSDDYLVPNCLLTVGKYFMDNKEAYWLTGKCHIVDAKDQEVRQAITLYKNSLLKYACSRTLFYIVQFISQPATFWSRKVIKEVGNFDEKLYYNMDYDFWLRVWQKHKLYFIDQYLASYRIHAVSKAMQSPQTQFKVAYEISRRYTRNPFFLWLNKLHAQIAVIAYEIDKSKHQ